MYRRILYGGAFLAVVMACSPLMAGWGSHGSSGGSSGGSWGSSGGSWGSSGGYAYASHGSSGGYSSGGSWGSSGGSYGSHGGLFSRLHARWHARHASRWHGSSGGYSSGGSWGSSGGSWGSSGGSSGGSSIGGSYYYMPADGYDEAAPMDGDAAPPVPSDPAQPMDSGDSSASTRGGDAMLTVNVPDDAKIFVNGAETRSTGTARTYVSRGLMPGFNYTYKVRAEMVRDGETVEETKVVNMRAGQAAQVAFDFQDADTTPETTLTLRVPADAKVFLAGAETNATGEVRSFRTRRLAPGEAWDNYAIRVTMDNDGQVLSKERQITLQAGETRELTFNFSEDQVATLNR